MAHLNRTMLALDEMKRHREHASLSSLLESYLAQYLLVSLCSEMEENLKRIVQHRVHISEDRKLAPFFRATIEGILKRISKSDIVDVAKKFGSPVTEQFEARLAEFDIQSYSNAIANRHLVAHSSGVSATFGDVERAIIAGNLLLEALEGAIH